MYTFSVIFITFFFFNMIKIPFLGIGLTYLTPLVLVKNIRNIRKLLTILFFISLYIFLQYINNTFGLIELLNLKFIFWMITGVIFGGYLYSEKNEKIISSINIFCIFLILLFLLTYFFKDDSFFISSV